MRVSETDKLKVYITFSVFVVLFLVILGRAFYLQVVNNRKLIKYSEGQIIREMKIFPNRGHIYDRNNNPLAINIQTYNIFAIPKAMDNRTKSMNKISKVLNLKQSDKFKKKIKGRDKFTWLARKIKLTKEQVAAVKQIKGVYLEKSTKRIYPNNETLGQVLGFVGVDNSGLAGIEYEFNDLLKGEEKVVKYMRDAKGRAVKFESYQADHRAEDIHLSIDKDLQATVEKYLRDAIYEHKASRGGVGVINAQTGEILAVANYPTFDPNNIKKSPAINRKLSFVTDPFEPGSIFKIFTVASALENKIITPETNYFCEHGRYRVGNHIIKESDTTKKHEWLTVSDIIKFSSNIGTTKIAFDLDFPLLDQTVKKFGFGEKAGIELPGESRGIYKHRDDLSKLSLSNLSFGQGIATTGVQILAAYAAIANGGIYYKPTITKQAERPVGERIISQTLAKKLEEMLVGVIEEGTATNVKIPYFTIAGKTGTAQKADSEGNYTSYIANFVGYPVNVENKFIVFSYVEDPGNGTYYGSKVAAPVVKKTIEYMLYRNKEYQNLAIKHENIKEQSIDQIKIKSSARFRGKGTVPNFVGLDKKSAQILSAKIGISIDSIGMGVVKSQSIEPGNVYNKDDVLVLRFSPPSYE